ncbi:hypothetical protein CFY91_01935 [Pseudomonas fluvialis]|nr:hypothetical protein CFY91_01935 [Pseudomonas fluvialis]
MNTPAPPITQNSPAICFDLKESYASCLLYPTTHFTNSATLGCLLQRQIKAMNINKVSYLIFMF